MTIIRVMVSTLYYDTMFALTGVGIKSSRFWRAYPIMQIKNPTPNTELTPTATQNRHYTKKRLNVNHLAIIFAHTFL